MEKSIYKLWLSFVCLCLFSGTTLARESSYLITDKSLYVSGESIWFSGYLASDEMESSNYLIIDLIGPDHDILSTQKVALTKKAGSGRIYLNGNFKTGQYTLRAYTSYLRNFGCDSYFHKSILVISPLDPLEFLDYSVIHKKTANAENQLFSPLTIAHQNNYQTREPVSISITLKNNDSYRVNVSVYKDYGDLHLANTKVVSGSPSNSIPFPAELYFPIFSGRLTASNNQSNIELISTADRSILWQIGSLQGDTFHVELIENSNTTKFYLWDGTFDEGLSFHPISQSVEQNECILEMGKFSISSSSKKDIEQLLIDSQIQNIYQTYTFPSGKSTSKAFKTDYFFENPLSLSYLLDDYKRFPTIKETLFEYVKGIYVRKDKNGIPQAYLFNDKTSKLYNGPALVLLDGIPVSFAFSLKVDPLLIEKISISNTPYYFGGKIRDGIIGFSSFKNNFANLKIPKYIKEVNIVPVEDPISFYAPNYEKSNSLERIPDRRSTLLWTEPILLNKDGLDLKFYTSDSKGKYVLKIEGFDHTGNHFIQTSRFTVH